MRLGIVFQGECRNKDNVVRAVQRMAKEKGYRAVSYTHLDVYKRQVKKEEG